MRRLTTNALGQVEIGDEENDVQSFMPLRNEQGRPIVWKGPYQPGGNDAVDVVDPSWPAKDYARAVARFKGFSDLERKRARSTLPAGYGTSSGAAKSSRTQISKPEYALLTVAVAQELNGSNTATPTAKQLAEAQKQSRAAILKAGVGVKGGTGKIDKLFDHARSELSGISGMGDDECGNFWDVIKSSIVRSAPVMPFLGPATALVIPTAALIAAKNQKKASAAQKPAPAPGPADDETDPVNTQVVGDDELMYGESITSTYDRALARLSGDDVLVYGEGGGASELGAAGRMTGRSRSSRSLSGADASDISPAAYRVAVIQRAQKLAGGGKPATKHVYLAQKSVDRDLSSGGINVRVPGAKPGRVTR